MIVSGGQTGVDRAALDAALAERVLNVAGPRASQAPELAADAYRLVRALLERSAPG